MCMLLARTQARSGKGQSERRCHTGITTGLSLCRKQKELCMKAAKVMMRL